MPEDKILELRPFIISDGSPITDSIDNNLKNSIQTSKNNNISSNNYYTKYEIEICFSAKS